MKRTGEAKAVALKPTPRKSFCKVAPQLLAERVSSALHSLLPGARAAAQGNEAQPAQAAAQRQEKTLPEYNTGKQAEHRRLVEVQ